MSTNFPTGLDSATNLPTAADLADDNLDTKPHSTLHGDLGLAVLALETKVGIDSSAVTTSLDYKLAQLATTYQPLDSDLTAIAALTTTSFGRSLLALANAAAGRTAFGLGTAAVSNAGDFDAAGAAAAAQAASQPLDSDLTAIAALTTTSYGRAFLALADAAAARTALGLGTAALSASTDFQPIDADLTAIAALATTSYGRALLALADATALRSTAGLVIGTNVQAWDADLDTWATKTAPSGTVVGTTDSQTLTNKSIAGSQINSGTVPIAQIPTGTSSSTVPLGGVITGAGPTGDASHTLALTYNNAGQLTAVTNNAIAIAESQVTNLTTDLAAKQSTTLTSAHLLVGNGSNVATDVAVSGDATLANTGALTIANLAVTNAKIAAATIDLTAKVTGILPVANGGQGANTLAAHGVVIGNGSSAVNVTGAGSSGQVLTSNGASADPTFQAVDIASISNGAIVTILARTFLK